MIVTQVAAASRLDALVSLPRVTLFQIHLKCASCTHRHQGPREVTGNTLAVGPKFVTLFAVRSHLDAATAAWLSCEPVLRLGLCLCLPPPSPALAKTLLLLLCSSWRSVKPVQPFQHPLVTIMPAAALLRTQLLPLSPRSNLAVPANTPTPAFSPTPPASILAPVLERGSLFHNNGWDSRMIIHKLVNLAHSSSVGNGRLPYQRI